MTRKTRKAGAAESTVEPNVLPVMNVMFLLIPALLLAMETASMAAVPVEAPRRGADLTSTHPGDPPVVRVDVMLRSDGIMVSVNDTPEPLIERTPSAQTHDFARLEAVAGELHVRHPDVSAVRISAENDVEYADVIAAMDALRGSECEWTNASETPGAGCMFWAPVLQSG